MRANESSGWRLVAGLPLPIWDSLAVSVEARLRGEEI
jgi:hypothetical protein